MTKEDLEKKFEEVLELEKWRSWVSGSVESALNVLFLLELSKEERIKLLAEAVGLSIMTATDFVEERMKAETE